MEEYNGHLLLPAFQVLHGLDHVVHLRGASRQRSPINPHHRYHSHIIIDDNLESPVVFSKKRQCHLSLLVCNQIFYGWFG